MKLRVNAIITVCEKCLKLLEIGEGLMGDGDMVELCVDCLDQEPEKNKKDDLTSLPN